MVVRLYAGFQVVAGDVVFHVRSTLLTLVQVWALYDDTPAETIAVEFKPHHSYILGKKKAATLGVSESVSDADSVFIILFLVYSHLTDLRYGINVRGH